MTMNNMSARKPQMKSAKKSPLNFSQVNINGLSKHSKTALDKFAYENNVSLIALQETILDEEKVNSLEKFQNLESFILPKTQGTYGVGLIISPQHQPQRVLQLEEDDCDIVWCLIKVNDLCVLTASAYSPPNNVQKFLKLLSNIKAGYQFASTNKIKDILIFGDFNGRNLIWGDTTTNSHGKKLIEFIDETDFMLCTPADKTFIAPNGGSVIDLLLGCGSITGLISDNWTDRKTELFTGAPIRGHFPVLYLIRGSSQSVEPKEYNDYKNADWISWGKFLEEMVSVELEKIEMEATTMLPTDYLGKLVSILDSAIMKANEKIPKKVVTRHSKPFWSTALTVCSNELYSLNTSLKTRLTPRNSQLFREKKEEFKQLLTSEKNSWIREKLSGLNPADSKVFWKQYKRLFDSQGSSYIGNLHKNGVLYNSDKDKESILFEEFFSGSHLEGYDFDANCHNQIRQCYKALIGSKMKLQPDIEHILTQTQAYLPKNCDTKIDALTEDELNENISMQEIDAAIHEQKSGNKTTDGYEVNPVMLKYLGPIAKGLLLAIFNLSLQTGCWQWSKQDVCFLKKTGKASYLDPGAYRPISISSYIGKLLEKILEKRLRKHCMKYGILDDPQEGFCPNRSTTRYLFKLFANLEEAKQKKLTSMVLLLDFQKAFDSVWIPGLITKLFNYGITGNILLLINNFLCNRFIRLKINGSFGDFRRLCALIGLPQGSVLSPLLFILFIAEMLGTIHNCQRSGSSNSVTVAKAYKFADDGTVTVTGECLNVCHEVLQEICKELEEWCKRWRLIINCDKNKTEVLVIQGGKENIEVDDLPLIMIGRDKIQYVGKSRVLGIILDNKLSFFHHAKDILKRCWFQWHRISKDTTRQSGLNHASLILMFKTLVIPKLMYASPTWLHKQLDLFKGLWARALLKIIGSQYHTERSLTEAILNIPPLDIQLEVISVKFFLKCLSSDDEMIAILLSVDQDTQHPMFPKIRQLKKFILWKQNTNNRQSVRSLDLINYIDIASTFYNNHEMRSYQNKLWWKSVKSKFPHLDVDNWESSNGKFIFPQGSLRKNNSVTADFIHGHSLEFRKFQCSIGLTESAVCQYCDGNHVDSNEHRLFECQAFNCEFRGELLNLLQNNIADFEWKLAVSSKNMDSSGIIGNFRNLVKFVSQETHK